MSKKSKKITTSLWVKKNRSRCNEYNKAVYHFKKYGNFTLMKNYIDKYRKDENMNRFKHSRCKTCESQMVEDKDGPWMPVKQAEKLIEEKRKKFEEVLNRNTALEISLNRANDLVSNLKNENQSLKHKIESVNGM